MFIRPTLLVTTLVVCFALPAVADSVSTSGITQEVSRTETHAKRLVHFWWLPLEFWEASAREQKMSEEQIAEVRRAFHDYLILGALDVGVGPDGQPQMSNVSDFATRTRVTRNGEELKVLREVNPSLAELAPKLVYTLKASLSVFKDGLVLLPLSNVNAKGDAILNGNTPGELHVEFTPDPTAAPLHFRWHAPLTAVAGANRCPKGGEELEAAWTFCPWHGVKAGAAPASTR